MNIQLEWLYWAAFLHGMFPRLPLILTEEFTHHSDE